MRKIKRTFLLLVAVCLAYNPFYFAQGNQLQDKSEKNEHKHNRDWRFNFGFSYSDPELKEADQAVEAVRQELALIAPNPPEFEKWGDIIKGAVWISIAKRKDMFNIPIWPEIAVAYAEGGIDTDGQGLPTIYPVAPNQFASLDFSYSTYYKSFCITYGAMAEVYRKNRFFFKAGVFGTYGILKSEVTFDSSIPLLATTRKVRGYFKEDDFGLAGIVEAGIDLDWPKNSVIAFQIRQDIGQVFKGPLNINDTTQSPPGNQIDTYSVQNISDMDRLTISLSIGIYF